MCNGYWQRLAPLFIFPGVPSLNSLPFLEAYDSSPRAWELSRNKHSALLIFVSFGIKNTPGSSKAPDNDLMNVCDWSAMQIWKCIPEYEIMEFYKEEGFQQSSETALSSMLTTSYVWQFKLNEILNKVVYSSITLAPLLGPTATC